MTGRLALRITSHIRAIPSGFDFQGRLVVHQRVFIGRIGFILACPDLNVFRYINEHGTRPAGLGDVKSLSNDLGQLW